MRRGVNTHKGFALPDLSWPQLMDAYHEAWALLRRVQAPAIVSIQIPRDPQAFFRARLDAIGDEIERRRSLPKS